MSLRGSRMRRIGRLRSEASPSNVAVIPWTPTTPIISRQPVPALPKSNASRGAKIAPIPGPPNSPCAGSDTLGDRAQSLASLAGPEHIVALEQSLNLRLAAGKETKQKRPVGDRFVARRPQAPLERSRALSAERRGRGVMRGGGGHVRASLTVAHERAMRRTALVSPTLETVDRRPIWRIDRAEGGD